MKCPTTAIFVCLLLALSGCTNNSGPRAYQTAISTYVSDYMATANRSDWVASYKKGVTAYKRQDYALALREIQPLATEGFAPAQYTLGIMYTRGHGVPEDYNEGMSWLSGARSKGYALAQFDLGVAYLRGGPGVLKDFAYARTLFHEAAEQGLAQAQHNLGVMYFWGDDYDTPLNYVQAYKWFKLAENQGYGTGTAFRRTSTQNAATEMTSAQIAEAERLAREWRAAFKKRQGK